MITLAINRPLMVRSAAAVNQSSSLPAIASLCGKFGRDFLSLSVGSRLMSLVLGKKIGFSSPIILFVIPNQRLYFIIIIVLFICASILIHIKINVQ